MKTVCDDHVKTDFFYDIHKSIETKCIRCTIQFRLFSMCSCDSPNKMIYHQLIVSISIKMAYTDLYGERKMRANEEVTFNRIEKRRLVARDHL